MYKSPINTHAYIVNYTGSIGFGDDSIEALEGQIGIRDVEDCYVGMQYFVYLFIYF